MVPDLVSLASKVNFIALVTISLVLRFSLIISRLKMPYCLNRKVHLDANLILASLILANVSLKLMVAV
jgi:hypothetical protein